MALVTVDKMHAVHETHPSKHSEAIHTISIKSITNQRYEESLGEIR
jgi:hypothetical protein